MKPYFLAVPLALLIAGCSAGEGKYVDSAASQTALNGSMPEEMAKSESPTARLTSQNPAPITRQVIRRADLAVRVPNVETAERDVNQMVQRWQGYVESAGSTDLATASPILTMAIRVPVEKFDEGIARLESLGVRLNKTVSSEDVTGQIVDLDARLKTLRAQEETYRGLLQKSTNLQNVIALQDKLTEVRGTIESMAAQRKTLGGLASLSSITLRLEQDALAHPAPKDPNWLAQTWGESTTIFGSALRAVASLLVYVAVFSPFWLPLAWLARRALRTERKVA